MRAVKVGDQHRNAREWASASAAYARALAIAPTRAPIWVQYGHALKEQGDPRAAEDAYNTAVSHGLDDADIHLQIGHARKLQRNFDGAARAYIASLQRDTSDLTPLRELESLGWSRRDLQRLVAGHALDTATFDHMRSSSEAVSVAHAATASTDPALFFDVTDVLHFLGDSRRPTGIQRVQLAVITALLDAPPRHLNIRLCCFSNAAGAWIGIDPALFRRLAMGMTGHENTSHAEWKRIVGEVTTALMLGNDAEFPQGARLINLGSSWAFPNYFLALRDLRRRSGVVHVAFIHDCIPIFAPDYFVPELQRDFREWIRIVLTHADALLANSHATADDVERAAGTCGLSAPVVATVSLDAPFPEAPTTGGFDSDAVRARAGVESGRFVLFVATIEPRKNHLLAFATWLALLQDREATSVPKLVCVGGRGWHNEPIMQFLADNPLLRDHVVLLRGISDSELDALYRSCRFTIYPSQYEGWGLPVTESLSKGRVPLVTRASSLPEAGGPFAVYFEPGDAADFRRKLEVMLDDDRFLDERQRAIAQHFRPRTWRAIAEDIVARSLAAVPRSTDGLQTPSLAYARFYRLCKDPPGALSSGVVSAEALRRGEGWGDQDDRCAWLSGQGQATLAFRTSAPRRELGRYILYLLVIADRAAERGPIAVNPTSSPDRHMLVICAGALELGRAWLRAGEERWIKVPLTTDTTGASEILLSFEVFAADFTPRSVRCVGISALYLACEYDGDARTCFIEGALTGAIRERLIWPDQSDASNSPSQTIPAQLKGNSHSPDIKSNR